MQHPTTTDCIATDTATTMMNNLGLTCLAFIGAVVTISSGAPADQYVCNDGVTTIPLSWRCDGISDCATDGGASEDEQGCTACNNFAHMCDDGRCVTNLVQCDDEEGHFACNDNQQIVMSWRCDGIGDCSDGEDERDCTECNQAKHCPDNTCVFHHIPCGSGPAAPPTGPLVVPDQDTGSRECTGFTCPNGECIINSWVCDDVDDCGDNADEQYCSDTSTPHVGHGTPNCTENSFHCHNTGLCIPGSWVCDSWDDCGDNSDEQADCPPCAEHNFQCVDTGSCISGHWKCDGWNDCNDGSDELDCPAGQGSDVDCSNDFTCPSGMCIPNEWICDGDNDCGDMSDEPDDCPAEPECHGFTCPSDGYCIPNEWICDGDNDCGDMSDEPNCPDAGDRPDAFACEGEHHRCSQDYCIPLSWVCDHIDDCEDLSDEMECPVSSSSTPSPNEDAPANIGSCFHHCIGHSGQRTCVTMAQMCDGTYDCADESDERSHKCPDA